MLEISNLTVRYGPFLAVDRLVMSVGKGEIVGIVGPNGGGKTSVVKAIGGLIRPEHGEISFDGTDLLKTRCCERVRRGISIVPEGRGLFPQMSVEENLQVGGDTLRDRRSVARNIECAYTMFPILAQRRWQAAGTMSGGQQQMLALSVGLMSDPRLLILDEPSLGLAPIVISEIGRAMKALREKGLAVVLFEQNAKLTCSVADRIYVLAGGRVQGEDSAANLLVNAELLEHLL
jgi:branched-chain amino acid transport system ATP-binding protein